MTEETAQIIYALERAIIRLNAEVDAYRAQHDYSPQFPYDDARRIEKAIEIVRNHK